MPRSLDIVGTGALIAGPVPVPLAGSVSTVRRKAFVAVGLAISVLAALLMLADVVDVGWGIAIGAVGVGVLGSSAAKR